MRINKFSALVLTGLLTLISITSAVYAEEVYVGEATYLNGGFGQEEADEIRTQAHDFNLRMYLSEGKSGYFITGVQVTVIDKKGNVRLDLIDAGPLLFLNVENGTYKIIAKYNDVMITKNVSIINHRGVNVYLNWKNLETDANDNVEESAI